jgi:hypothetical protein
VTDSSNLWDKLVSLVTICYKEENDFNGEFASVQSFVSTHLFLCTFISFKVQGDCWGKAEGSGVLPIYMWVGSMSVINIYYNTLSRCQSLSPFKVKHRNHTGNHFSGSARIHFVLINKTEFDDENYCSYILPGLCILYGNGRQND